MIEVTQEQLAKWAKDAEATRDQLAAFKKEREREYRSWDRRIMIGIVVAFTVVGALFGHPFAGAVVGFFALGVLLVWVWIDP